MMAPVYTTSSAGSSSPLAENPPTEARYSALTTAGESLFMCSSKEGHVCYHACRGHGRYPLWSDEEFMVDDVDEEEKNDSDCDSDDDFDSDEEWITDGEDHTAEDAAFWREIQESVERTRAERSRTREQERIYYSASDLRFLLADEDTPADIGPVVGVIVSKPPPEYVWYVADDNEAWMRGSQPEKLTEEQDGAYYRYRYHVWDRIPNSEVRGSSDESNWEDDDDDDDESQDRGNEEGEEGSGAETRSWSELADIQENQHQQKQEEGSQQPSC